MTPPTTPEPELPELDSPPRSGRFIDHDARPLTLADIQLGNALGETIDPDDDGDRDGGLL